MVVANMTTLAHRQSLDASIQEMSARLQELLTRRLTAYIAGVDAGKTVTRWVNGETAEIRDPEVERRLRTAYQIALLLLNQDSPQTVRSWFIGLNPQLGDVSPAEAIHDGHLKDALTAARAFLAGG